MFKPRLFELVKNLRLLYTGKVILWREVALVENIVFPKCQKCNTGDLVPLSDFGSQGAPIHYKVWVCTNPECGFNIKIRNGDIYVNEPILSGAVHTNRYR
ncbi:MAG TPA: hypothetical protein VEG28_01545 [Dehalococcoidia bacterium]|nr:hypothetical protein [Dehalococcoidia bacterium]